MIHDKLKHEMLTYMFVQISSTANSTRHECKTYKMVSATQNKKMNVSMHNKVMRKKVKKRRAAITTDMTFFIE